MPYVVKRYANRKLYDTRTKRYLTLDDVAAIVRAGDSVTGRDVPTREEFDRLAARVTALESKTRRAAATAARRKVTAKKDKEK